MALYNNSSYTIGVVNNPITDSVYFQSSQFVSVQPVTQQNLATEAGLDISTEDLNFLTTE